MPDPCPRCRARAERIALGMVTLANSCGATAGHALVIDECETGGPFASQMAFGDRDTPAGQAMLALEEPAAELLRTALVTRGSA